MTELFIKKLDLFREHTGTRGVVFLLFAVLFFISLISDVVYGLSTNASAAIKVILLLGLGTSFVFLFQDSSFKRSKYTEKENSGVREPQAIENTLEIAQEDSSRGVLEMVREKLVEHKNKERAHKQHELAITKRDSESQNIKTYLGVNISDVVKISEKYAEEISVTEISELMNSDTHDERIIAIWLLINKYKISNTETKHAIYDFYVHNRNLVENWDMVDLAARNIVGAYLVDNPSEKSISDMFITSDSVWDNRTAIMSAHPLVLEGDLGYGFAVSERLIGSKQELVQSAIGWVLKEAYKQDPEATKSFITSHFHSLSKQAIRIGTERMEKNYRKSFLRGDFSQKVGV